MLNAEKVSLMTKLARYENEQGQADLKVSRYYRSDYIGIGLLKNLIIISIGYIFLWGLIVAYNLDFLLDNLHKLNFGYVIFEVIIGYAVIVVIYSVITYIMRYACYEKAQQSVKGYQAKLGDLMELYGEPDTRDDSSRPAGGEGR
jgi:hypothetical protein